MVLPEGSLAGPVGEMLFAAKGELLITGPPRYVGVSGSGEGGE